jgi:hypothetical protein
MGDDKKFPIDIESFRPVERDPILRAFRPLDRSGAGDNPFDTGGGSMIGKPDKSKGGKPKPGKP